MAVNTWSRKPKPWSPPPGKEAMWLARIEARCEEEGACWLYQTKQKRPMVHIRGCIGSPSLSLQKAVYLLRGNELKPGMYVTARCNNPFCINPAHLHAANQAVIARKAAKTNEHRSRARAMKISAARTRNSKWSDAEVAEIRMSSKTPTELAAQYGMSRSMASMIKRGKTRTGALRMWAGLV